MKAIVVKQLGNRDALALEEVEAAAPAPGEVSIAVRAVSLNFPDLMMIDGSYQIKPALPFVLGKDAAGVVLATGEGVTRVAAGDRVLVQLHHGAFAERITVPAQNVFPLPAAVSFEKAAALGLTFKTAWLGLIDRAQIKAGESLLVLGASGGVGLAAVQLAKALGVRVIAGLTTPAKADLVRKAGVDRIVHLDTDADTIRRDILAANQGKAVDVVFDTVGGAALEAAIRAVAWKGRVLIVGFTSGAVPALRANHLLIKNIGVLGVGSNTYEDEAPDLLDRAFAEVLALAEQGRIDPVIHAAYPFTQFAKAISDVAERRAVGKVVLTIP